MSTLISLVDRSEVYSKLRSGVEGAEQITVNITATLGDDDSTSADTYASNPADPDPADIAGKCVVLATFDVKAANQESAAYSIAVTVLVGILLVGGAAIFTMDAQKYVLTPVENMVRIVNQMVEDPLIEFSSQDNTGMYETNLLENTIKKIGGLMRVSFGDAGSDIVARDLHDITDWNYTKVVPGRRTFAIYGYCHIIDFSRTTEVLQEDVMVYVNRIAKTVHDIAAMWDGAANKNLGNSFLLVWNIEGLLREQDRGLAARIAKKKTALQTGRPSAHNISILDVNKKAAKPKAPKDPKAKTSLEDIADEPEQQFSAGAPPPSAAAVRAPMVSEDPAMPHKIDTDALRIANRRMSTTGVGLATLQAELAQAPAVAVLADKALIAFLKIHVQINRSKEITDYNHNAQLRHSIPGFRVRMGFGIHAGWAIEGAVGSSTKLSALYLSSNVGTASRMTQAAALYGVPLLFTEAVYALLSQGGKKYCRKLDVIAFKASAEVDGVLPPQVDGAVDAQSVVLKEKPYPVYTYDIWDTHESKRLDLLSFADIWDKEDTWQRDKKVLQAEERLISVTGAAAIREHKIIKGKYSADIFSTLTGDADLVAMRAHIDGKFRQTFKSGVDAYLGGDWPKAKECFEECLTQTPHKDGDGPTNALMNFMSKNNFVAPTKWKGFHVLDAPHVTL